MGLFSDMEKFGLGDYVNTEIIEKKEHGTGNAEEAAKQIERKEEDYIFDKKYTCPVCDVGFTSKCVKTGKVKNSGHDTDLRPLYDFMDPLKYDVVACSCCGYASLVRYYGRLSTRQIKELKANIGNKFSGLKDVEGIFSYDDAITRHKLALICSVVKGAKNSERAYTSLKTAWVLRGKRLTLDEKSPEYKELLNDEMDCLKSAYEGFLTAISNEPFPIAGMDESTVKYIMADLARKLKRYEEAARLLASVLSSKATINRLKDEALELKELIKKDIAADRA
ncbi:MAG: DUF2225 domain-containing protein [Lachnospiraceae bacterium]|nr:DUF2225 domain-containing protein [Lachnospiraceae bacterium]